MVPSLMTLLVYARLESGVFGGSLLQKGLWLAGGNTSDVPGPPLFNEALVSRRQGNKGKQADK